MIKRVSCVLRLFDSALGISLTASQAEISVDGERVKPVWKPGGYFVLVELPEGEHTVRVGSMLFDYDEFTVVVDYTKQFDERRDVRTVMLNPTANHPSVRTGVTIRGRFDCSGVTVYYIPRGIPGFKIAEDGAEAGRTRIKLFTKSSNVRVPQLCYINDKNEKNGELVILSAVDGDTYTLDAALNKPHKRAEELVPMLKYRSNADGSFYARLPQCYKSEPETGKYEVPMLIETDGGIVSYTAILSCKGENDIGTVVLK